MNQTLKNASMIYTKTVKTAAKDRVTRGRLYYYFFQYIIRCHFLSTSPASHLICLVLSPLSPYLGLSLSRRSALRLLRTLNPQINIQHHHLFFGFRPKSWRQTVLAANQYQIHSTGLRLRSTLWPSTSYISKKTSNLRKSTPSTFFSSSFEVFLESED